MSKKALCLLGAFVLIVSILILTQNTGPFFDEGIYITAGLRYWHGQAYGDGFLVWQAGSLIWPAFSGVAYNIGGLVGVRFMSLAFIVGSMISIILATSNLFNKKAATFAALVMLIYGSLRSMAMLGVYDSPGIFGICLSIWAATKLFKTENRNWIFVSAAAFMFGAFSKYPFVAMGFVPLGILYLKRGDKFRMDLFLFIAFSLVIFLFGFLPVREQLGAWLAWTVQNKPTFGVQRRTLAFAQVLYLGLPLGLALLGAPFLKNNRKLAAILLLGGVVWPLYHILAYNPVSDWKHATLGFLVLAIVLGEILSKLSESVIGKVVLVLFVAVTTVHGVYVTHVLNAAWPDVRPGAEFLESRVKPEDMLLIDDSWPYTMYLYANDNITSPWYVFDNYRITHDESPIGLCNYQWIVMERGSYVWPETVRDAFKVCGFKEVFEFKSSFTGLGSDFQFHTPEILTTIYQGPARTEGVK